jgi:hypothetical protein
MTIHTHPLRLLAVWVMIAIVAMTGGRAAAQDKSVLARADFGWNTTITAGRWCPVRVWLDGSADSDPVSGVIEISYSQDRTQNAAVVVPASTTPGKLTPIDLAVCLPFDVGSVKVTFSSGKGVRTLEFTPPPTSGQTAQPRRGEQRLGQLFAGTRGVMVHSGVGSIERSFPKPREVDRAPSVGNQIVTNYTGFSGDQLTELRWMQLAATDVSLEDLPPIPQAYQGLEALIIDPGKSSGIEPRVRGAILDWVASGGRLILLATDETGAWRQWLTPGLGEAISASVPGRLVPPAELNAVLLSEVLKVSASHATNGNLPQYRGYPQSVEVTVQSEAAPVVPLRKEIVGRVFTLSEDALAQGWSASWSTGAGSGLMVRGPMGMGVVTILGVDPEAVPDALDAQASKRLWRDALTPSIATYLATPFSDSHARDREVSTALNTIVSVPPLGNTVFNVILISLGALALLLGPIDWFVLKRFRARQHSWLVALGWVSLASVAAFVIPPRLRSGPPQINRLTSVDVVQLSNDLKARAFAWQDGLTGIFASGPLRIVIDDSSETEVAGSWWHGIAPEDDSYYGPFSEPRRNSLNIFAPLVTPQLTSVDRERQSVPVPFNMPSWSYRTLADSSVPEAPPIRATISREGERFKVRLSGLPDVGGIGRLTLFTSSDASRPQTEVDFVGEGDVPLATGATLPTFDGLPFDYDRFGNRMPNAVPRSSQFWACELPGPSRRFGAIKARLDSGRWAMVELVLTAPVPSSRFLSQKILDRENFVSSDLTTIRLLVPIGSPAESPSQTPSKEPAP